MDTTAVVTALIAILSSVLAWMMGRMDRRLDRIDRSMERFSKAVLLEVVSRPGVALSVAREGEALLKEIREERDRGGSA